MTKYVVPEQLRVPLRESEREFTPTTVCVTGATGYVAGPLIHRLLEAGHTVHATCRDPSKEASVAHLKALRGADKRLKLFKADLLDEGSFDAAVKGTQFVFHTASPYVLTIPKGKEWETVVGPALQGTANVLGSVNRCESVQRVILTSSIAAAVGDYHERGADHVITEKDWNLAATEHNLAYSYSKRVAEEHAFQMWCQQKRWSLVTILPGQIMGPPLRPSTSSTSVQFMQQVMGGKMYPAAPPLYLSLTDVRDVALAHCLAMVKSKASGRYLIGGPALDLVGWGELLREKYGKYWLPRLRMPLALVLAVGPYIGIQRDVARAFGGKIPKTDCSKAKNELLFDFLPAKDTLQDMAAALIEMGVIPKK